VITQTDTTAGFITITDTAMEVEGDVMRTQVARRKRTI
jgi:hypothetical protein